MSSNAWVLSQDAELHLRGGVRARVTWPPATAADRPPLLVLVPGRGEQADAELCRELAIRLPALFDVFEELVRKGITIYDRELPVEPPAVPPQERVRG